MKYRNYANAMIAVLQEIGYTFPIVVDAIFVFQYHNLLENNIRKGKEIGPYLYNTNKPDWDNLIKSFMDAAYKEDSGIVGTNFIRKYWGPEDQIWIPIKNTKFNTVVEL